MFNLPKSYETIRTPFEIPKIYKKLGVIADIHIPYHSISALNACLDYLIKAKIDSLLLNGDMIDFHMISHFAHDPRKRSVKEELDALRDFLDLLKLVLPDTKIFFKNGNHDDRYEKYLMTKAPEIFGNTEFELTNLLHLYEKNIDFIDGRTKIKAGGLTIWHGHELKLKSIAVNPARSLFLKAGITSMVSHLHVPSQHNWKRSDGHIIGCWSTGHLSEESPDYAVENGWIHGFAIVDIEGKEFEVSNFKILKGKVYRT